MSVPGQSDRIPWVRLAVAVLFLLAGLWQYGRSFVEHFRPASDKVADLVQEWLSAKNYFAGYPIYEHQVESINRYFPGANHTKETFTLHHNAHPPGSVLLALPFAGLDYWNAHFAWNLITIPLLLAAIGLTVWQVCRPFRWWHLVPIAAVLVWAEPVRITITYGQINFVLALLLVAGWVLDRQGKQTAGGVCVGLAAGLKLFPAFVLLYFLVSGRWKGLLAGILTAVAVNGIAAGVFGVGAFQDYVQNVVPAVRERWEATWPNTSLNGLWIRVANPPEQQTGPGAFRSPLLAKAGFGACGLLIAAGTAWAAWRSRKEGDPDIGWAVAVAALPLVSPMAWQHYYALHVVPLAVLAARLHGWRRYVGWVAVGGICIPDVVYTVLFVSKTHSMMRTKTAPYYMPLDPVEALLGTGVIPFCGLVLFVLAVTLPKRAAELTPDRLTAADELPPSLSPAGTPALSPAPGL